MTVLQAGAQNRRQSVRSERPLQCQIELGGRDWANEARLARRRKIWQNRL